MPLLTRRHLLHSGLTLSVGSVVASRAAQAAEFLRLSAETSDSTLAPRERLLMDFNWKFFQGNGTDPSLDLDFGAGQGDFAKAGAFSFAKKEFDDAKWRKLNLPHDWAVELPFVHDDSLQGHGYKPLGRRYPATSVGWYRREFEVPKEDKGRRISFEFDGVFRDALVFMNGFFLGRNNNGYCPFSFDVTDYVNWGGPNFLVVRVDASQGDGWFYEGAGIYRHVWMLKTDLVHLGRWESYVRSDLQGDAAVLHLGAQVQNQGEHAASCRVRWTIFDPQKKRVATGESVSQQVPPDGSASFTASVNVPKPELWSPQTPMLYTAEVAAEADGKECDAEAVRFGVRTARFDVDKGFLLNGKQVKIKGTCNHQDHAGVGVALPDSLQRFRLAVLKEMGSNAVRTSHNMPTPEWVEACDRMGMMMLCEARLMESTSDGLAQLETMIKRYRNSPSIILWGMGNEEWPLQFQPAGDTVVAAMVRRSHELDPTRLCTAATTSPFDNSVSRALDVEGFNYSLKDIDAYRKAYPHKPLIGTETASTVSTRGIYSTDKLRNWVSAYDVNHTDWSEVAEEWWKFYTEREWLAGGFAWTGFDYRGEPTPYGWPSISSQFGIVDTCGFPKDNFFYYKAWWGNDPVLHLLPHWNWEGREGEEISVWAHSNLDEVELFLNGVSLGRQKVPLRGHVEWKVKYEPGVLEARGLKNGAVVLTDRRETTGKPESLRIVSDRMEIDANGQDVAMLRVEALDSAGRPVPTADTMVTFKVGGEGTLIGVGNGDPNCLESDRGPKRSLFSGLAQGIVQSTRRSGTIVVEVSTEEFGGKLKPARLEIKSRNVVPPPGISRLIPRRSRNLLSAIVVSLVIVLAWAPTLAQKKPAAMPWMDKTLSPDKRAELVVTQMTLDEKLQMVHGIGWGVLRDGDYVPPADNGGAGFVPGIKRLGIQDINLADSAVGVRMAGQRGRYSTLLPSTLGAASSWDPAAAYLYGSVIGRELRAQGYNMSIGGGVNLVREPRNGRNFEYAGEDPLLAGVMTGNLERGLQAQQVMGDIKHYALNDQETGRNILNVILDRKAMRESDLLAFQIAVSIAQPSAVMCSYNRVDGDYACENDYLLNQLLKRDWGFKGWVMSDWEGTHSTIRAALSGLDQEQPGTKYFGDALKQAIASNQVPQLRLDDMVHRILRSMFAAGVIDNPPISSVVDPFQGRDDAQHIAEESIVLLKNERNVLPLAKSIRSIALIGSHADVGVLSGGGSAQVDSPGGNAIDPNHGGSVWGQPVYFPSSPLKEIRRTAPQAHIAYNDGHSLADAAAAAKAADVAIVFTNQYMSEGQDAATLSLPDNQDALVAAVAVANPRTIVVLETGGPVSMPWHRSVQGILEAWYPGIGGAQALAALLFGDVNPSGKLPVTFAARDEDLPHPQVPGRNASITLLGNADGSGAASKPFDVTYTEGVRFGYKWSDSLKTQPLFPFGYGLSYTTFEYSGLKIDDVRDSVTFAVTNTGRLAGDEIAEVYVELPSSYGENFKRLAGWQRVSLAPGESRTMTSTLSQLAMSVFDVGKDSFVLPKGTYRVLVGGSSRDTPLTGALVH
jgi:beta-galactosidase